MVVGDLAVSVPVGYGLPGWDDLLVWARRVLVDGTGRPVAAVAVRVGADGLSASLAALGTDPVPVDVSDLRVDAVLWRDGLPAGRWSTVPHDLVGLAGTRVLPAGGTLALPFAHDLDPRPGDDVRVTANLVLRRDGEPAPVAATGGATVTRPGGAPRSRNDTP